VADVDGLLVSAGDDGVSAGAAGEGAREAPGAVEEAGALDAAGAGGDAAGAGEEAGAGDEVGAGLFDLYGQGASLGAFGR
jgi:streptogrisin D